MIIIIYLYIWILNTILDSIKYIVLYYITVSNGTNKLYFFKSIQSFIAWYKTFHTNGTSNISLSYIENRKETPNIIFYLRKAQVNSNRLVFSDLKIVTLEKQGKIKRDKERKAGKQKRDNKMAARMRTLAPAIWSWKLKYNHQTLVLSTTLLIASYAR